MAENVQNMEKLNKKRKTINDIHQKHKIDNSKKHETVHEINSDVLTHNREINIPATSRNNTNFRYEHNITNIDNHSKEILKKTFHVPKHYSHVNISMPKQKKNIRHEHNISINNDNDDILNSYSQQTSQVTTHFVQTSVHSNLTTNSLEIDTSASSSSNSNLRYVHNLINNTNHLNYIHDEQTSNIPLHYSNDVPTSQVATQFTQIDVIRNDSLNNISEHYLGSMNVLCIHCKAKHFKAEKVNKGNSFNDCCCHGKVILPPLPNPPPVLKQLFEGTHPSSNHFYNNIRKYNNTFSFASFNANLVQFNNRRPGPFCFKIQGQIYYQINTALYPENDDLPSFGQLFIIDSNEATNYRMDINSTLNADTLKAIDNEMREYNIFAKSYEIMKKELDRMTENNDGNEPELQLLFTLKKGQDKRRYNEQRINEVAAIFSTTADGEIPESYVTIRNKHSKQLQYVSSMDANVEPWTYPLFNPHGSRGWCDDMKMVNSNRRVTRNAYIKYRMAIRDEPNYFLMGRRLFQQWTVDNYI